MSDEKYLKESDNRINNSQVIPQEDKIILLEYLKEKDSQRITPCRHYKLASALSRVRELKKPGSDETTLKPFKECTTDDILSAFIQIKTEHRLPTNVEIKQGITSTTQPLKRNTISDLQRIFKSFVLWLCENNYNTLIDINKVRKAKPEPVDDQTVKKEDLFTADELQRFFAACKTPRDRALFTVMYEGGLRVGEIGNLQFKDLEITAERCIIKTNAKTGKLRTIPIFINKRYLIEWINLYPKGKHTEEDFVFINSKGEPMRHAAISRTINRIGKRAGINKKLHAHLFRHTRITDLCTLGLNQSHLKQLAWGNQSTDMMATYVHLTSTDLEDALAAVQGIKKEKPSNADILKPRICERCGCVNQPTDEYCNNCFAPLTLKAQNQMDGLYNQLIEKMKNTPGVLLANQRALK